KFEIQMFTLVRSTYYVLFFKKGNFVKHELHAQKTYIHLLTFILTYILRYKVILFFNFILFYCSIDAAKLKLKGEYRHQRTSKRMRQIVFSLNKKSLIFSVPQIWSWHFTSMLNIK